MNKLAVSSPGWQSDLFGCILNESTYLDDRGRNVPTKDKGYLDQQTNINITFIPNKVNATTGQLDLFLC